MTEQTRAEKEMAITVLSLALWGVVIMFGVVAGLFLIDIIPSDHGVIIGACLLAVAGLNYVLMKVMVGKMEAELESSGD